MSNRIYDLAKQYNIHSKEILDLLKQHNIEVKSHMSTVDDAALALIRKRFDPAASREAYEYMLAYSPYDNVVAQDYPAMLVTTGLWDSQVQYWEPVKWVARLRETRTDERPLLMRINLEAGHGGKSGRFERYREIAEEYAFVLDQAGLGP